MTSPLDIARRFTGLDAGSRHHLELLMATWSLLADLSFSDLLLYVPLEQYDPPEPTPGTPATGDAGGRADGSGTGTGTAARGVHFVVLGQIRPTTGRTLFELDLVGQVVAASQLPLVVACWRGGVTTAGEERGPTVCQVQCVPVRWRGEVLAVLCRSWSPDVGRRPGQLERTYLDVFDRFTTMIADGIFPFVSDEAAIEEAPRVGDGVIIVDEYARVTFTSPNALSALHRMGVVSVVAGSSLSWLGGEANVVERSFTTRLPVIEEVERPDDVVVMFRCIPLVAAGEVSGAVLLVRDVSDLRRRDRLLLSKDAAIREVHHRVKNNLQTISSLLRLQARRLDSPGARAGLLESERRIRSIALVHELLSRESGDHVPFGEIVHALVRAAMDSNVTTRPVSIRVDGDPGEVETDVATPLAVVLAELLQNAVQHAFAAPPERPDGDGDGRGEPDATDGDGEGESAPARVDLVFMPGPDRLRVEVRDNGQGLPPGFDIDTSGSLGLAIVRDLVRSQLSGTMEMSSGSGTVVRLTVPLLSRPARRV
jgi:two-component sensor histidine kinase